MHGSVDEPEDDTELVITFEDIEARQRQDELGVSQTQTLDLRPWQTPTDRFFWEQDSIEEVLAAGPKPVAAGAEFQCATLAKRLLDAGLSLVEPDPERALNNPAYQKEIKDRVRKLKAANRNGLTDQALETVILLAPYPLMREEEEKVEFRKLLAEQSQVRDLDACMKVMSMMWEQQNDKPCE